MRMKVLLFKCSYFCCHGSYPLCLLIQKTTNGLKLCMQGHACKYQQLFLKEHCAVLFPEMSMITNALIASTHSYHHSLINPNISLLKLQAIFRGWGRENPKCCEHQSSPRIDTAILHYLPPVSHARSPWCTGWGRRLCAGPVEDMEAALVFYHHKLLTTKIACFKCITMLLSS